MERGIYEQIISVEVADKIDNVVDILADTRRIDKAESFKILTNYIKEVLERAFRLIGDRSDPLKDQVRLANVLINIISEELEDEAFKLYSIDKRAEELLSIVDKMNNVDNKIDRPETSISQSSLFTGSAHEPQLFSELKKEIISSDRIDMLVAFIKWSGLRLIYDELRDFTERGGELRVISTPYMGATDLKAIEKLRELNNTQIKISYDTKNTRLHAKTYMFHRNTGFSTAYIGSSNLSNSALSTGLEWNIKITEKDMHDTYLKLIATYENYWNRADFEGYEEQDKDRLRLAIKGEDITNEVFLPSFDIKPYYFQKEILEKLEVEREVKGKYRNLIVSATGARVIIVTGCINALVSRVSETLTKNNSCIA